MPTTPFGWDYPPGVTGGEYEIAGPDYEKEFVEYPCPECGEVLMEQGYKQDAWIFCPDCDYQTDLEPPERDWDRVRDERRDQEFGA